VVLTTGRTDFKQAVQFTRHISNLARCLIRFSVRSALAQS
jgi:hypothetical protein